MKAQVVVVVVGVELEPWPLYSQERELYPYYRKLGGPQGWSGWVLKISMS
jgi:hypothetical protein